MGKANDASGPGDAPLLEVRGLTVRAGRGAAATPLVHDMTFSIHASETVGMVGESGAGKTLTALALLGLLPPACAAQGSVRWRGQELLGRPHSELRAVRGAGIGFVPQDPLSALHPFLPVDRQVGEALQAHRPGLSRRAAVGEAHALLRSLRVPLENHARWAFQWSGGMRQRALIAMAMANGPALLIADEPTTALDLATRTAVLELLREVQQRTGAALLLITHDMGVVAQMTERVVIVGRGGRVIEQGDTADVCARPRHPEAVRLISSVHHEHAGTTPPQLPQPRGDELLLVQDLTIRYSHGGRLGWFARGWTEAVRGVGFSLRSGETFAVVGESGGGKSTLGRALVGLERPHAGRVVIAGCDITRARGNRLRAVRASIQLVFQDPGSSLNPRLRIGTSIAQPLHAQGRFRELGGTRRVRDLLAMVELPDHFQDRFPHELSGGERQRVAIARALGLDPRILVLDEPVTALDAAARGGIMRLLRQLQMDTGFACVLIAHDLGLVRGFAHETAVMRAGRFVEVAATDQLFTDPQHEYTRELLSLARPCACCAVSLSGARAEPLRS